MTLPGRGRRGRSAYNPISSTDEADNGVGVGGSRGDGSNNNESVESNSLTVADGYDTRNDERRGGGGGSGGGRRRNLANIGRAAVAVAVAAGVTSSAATATTRRLVGDVEAPKEDTPLTVAVDDDDLESGSHRFGVDANTSNGGGGGGGAAMTLDGGETKATATAAAGDGISASRSQPSLLDDDSERLTVVVLDPAQKKFPITADPDWTIKTFKMAGATVHKVPPPSQRLIYRGKMLDDPTTLREAGITDNVIIHLFPKPRVVVTRKNNRGTNKNDKSGSGSRNNNNNNNDDAATVSDEDDSSSDGAHVPQIVYDEEEQERRGQILVLGSTEVTEAQNNVKLLSLLLLVVCSMRLLALFTIALGMSQEPVYEDDLFNNGDESSHNHTDTGGGSGGGGSGSASEQYQNRHWENPDYFDLVVSGVGFYVATLGMKATTDNTSRLANNYFIGTIIAGVLWNIWNIFMYTLFVREESVPGDDDEEIPLTRDDFVTVAFFTVMLPIMVWALCCTRAWHFRRLIGEAEREAAERIRLQLNLTEEDADSDDARELTEISSTTTTTAANPSSSATVATTV